MLFKARYSQEFLERLKSLIQEESVLKTITGFISDDKWIYFEPVAFHEISDEKIRSVLPREIKPVRGEGLKTHTLFSFAQENTPVESQWLQRVAGVCDRQTQCASHFSDPRAESAQIKPRQRKRHCHPLQQ